MKKIWIITLFPEMFTAFKEYGVIGQAFSGQRGREIELKTVQLRDYSPKNYKGVDSSPYGGGAGMVIRADVLKAALDEGVVAAGGYGEDFRDELHIVFPTPGGRRWENRYCREFASRQMDVESKDLVFICGRYEGIDQRFVDLYIDEQISLGDYILTGGELAVMAILDSALRFCPGVVGNKDSVEGESFATEGVLEHPHYTRPLVFEGREVPSVLTSGDHAKIESWRREMSGPRKSTDKESKN